MSRKRIVAWMLGLSTVGMACSDSVAPVNALPDSGSDASPEPGDGGVDANASETTVPSNPRKGWQLDATNTGLAPLGLACDGLPVYTGGKPAAGAKIVQQRIETQLDLSAGNIVIERSCIRPAASGFGKGLSIVLTTDNNVCDSNGCKPTPDMVTIRDSEIDGSLVDAASVAYSCAFSGVGTLERNYMHGMGSGICFFNTGDHLDAVAEGNYITKLRATGDPATTGSHNESFTIRDFDPAKRPERRATVRNNRLDSSSGSDTGAFFIQAWAGYIDQVRVEGNLLEGNGYQLVLEANDNGYGRNMAAVDNRFSGTGYGPGYVTAKALGYGWSTWTSNYLNDPSKPDHQGKAVADFGP